jgi:hypothetical protein
MSDCNKLVVFSSALIILAAPLFGATADAKTKTKTGRHYQQFVNGPLQPSVRRTANGELIDKDGWRFKNGQWTSDCFRTLDYMPTDFACRR